MERLGDFKNDLERVERRFCSLGHWYKSKDVLDELKKLIKKADHRQSHFILHVVKLWSLLPLEIIRLKQERCCIGLDFCAGNCQENTRTTQWKPSETLIFFLKLFVWYWYKRQYLAHLKSGTKTEIQAKMIGRWRRRLTWFSLANNADESGQQKEMLQLRSGWSLWLIYLVIRNWACWGHSGHSTASSSKNGSFSMAAMQPLPDRQECTRIVQVSFAFDPITHRQEDLLAPIGSGFVFWNLQGNPLNKIGMLQRWVTTTDIASVLRTGLSPRSIFCCQVVLEPHGLAFLHF